MDLSIELKGVDKLMAQNATFSKKLPGTVLNGIRRQVRRTITTVKRDIRTQSSIGRKIWGKKPSGLNKIVTLIKARAAEKSIETGIKLKGLPALIETGGQLKRHEIKGKPFLIFTGSQGLVFARKVQHPGAPVRRHDYAAKALQRDAPAVNTEVKVGIDKLIQATFG